MGGAGGEREQLAYPSQRRDGGRRGGGGRLQETLLGGGGGRGGLFLQKGAGRCRRHVIDVLKVGRGGDEGVTGRGRGGRGRQGGREGGEVTDLNIKGGVRKERREEESV